MRRILFLHAIEHQGAFKSGLIASLDVLVLHRKFEQALADLSKFGF
jgi:hypothetical protein